MKHELGLKLFDFLRIGVKGGGGTRCTGKERKGFGLALDMITVNAQERQYMRALQWPVEAFSMTNGFTRAHL